MHQLPGRRRFFANVLTVVDMPHLTSPGQEGGEVHVGTYCVSAEAHCRSIDSIGATSFISASYTISTVLM